jgi:hypothetical protein
MSNLRISILVLLIASVFSNCKNSKSHSEEKVKTEREWVSLFNGVDLENWKVKIKGHPLGVNWKNTFIIVDSAIRVDYTNYENFENSFGHIFYKNPYSNYRLKLKYRFIGEQLAGGENWANKNSGVMIHCQPPESMELDQNFPVCLEVQLLGGLIETEARSTGNLCTPGTHVEMDNELVTAHCIDSNSGTYYGEEWVDLEVEVRNDSIISHYINGKKVIEYAKPVIGGEYNTLINKDLTPLKEGYISLQSESHPVEFKDIMLLEL